MTLEEFFVQQRRDLADFIERYNEGITEDPDYFPSKREDVHEWYGELMKFLGYY